MKKRGLLWWVSAILAPIGLIGGPLEIASILSGVIEWRGLVAFAIHYWDMNVGELFEAIFAWLFRTFGLRPPPDGLVDYLALGTLLSFSEARADKLIPVQTAWHDNIFGLPPTLVQSLISTIRFVGRHLLIAISWPVWLVRRLLDAFGLARDLIDVRRRLVRWTMTEDTDRGSRLLMALAPFLIFLLLWALNVVSTKGP